MRPVEKWYCLWASVTPIIPHHLYVLFSLISLTWSKLESLNFISRNAMLARYMLSSCDRPSFGPSVTSRHCTKWLNVGSRKQRYTIAQGKWKNGSHFGRHLEFVVHTFLDLSWKIQLVMSYFEVLAYIYLMLLAYSASRGPSAIAELLLQHIVNYVD